MEDDQVAESEEEPEAENGDEMDRDAATVEEQMDDADNDQVEANEDAEPEELTPEEATDVSKWKEIFEKMHPSILRGLRDVGFLEPTGIQREVLKPALISRKDIIGAAETVRSLPVFGLALRSGRI